MGNRTERGNQYEIITTLGDRDERKRDREGENGRKGFRQGGRWKKNKHFLHAVEAGWRTIQKKISTTIRGTQKVSLKKEEEKRAEAQYANLKLKTKISGNRGRGRDRQQRRKRRQT